MHLHHASRHATIPVEHPNVKPVPYWWPRTSFQASCKASKVIFLITCSSCGQEHVDEGKWSWVRHRAL